MDILTSSNPAKNYTPVGDVNISSLSEIEDKVNLAHKAKLSWKEIGIEKRIQYVQKIFDALIKRKDEFADLTTKETGKPIKESRANFERYIFNAFEWFLDNAKKYLGDEITHEDTVSINKILYEPYGVAAVIMPWNFPLEMFVWGVIPNLLAGNVVVMKHSEECPLIGKLIEEVINSTDLPKGVFSEVYGGGKVGEDLINQNINLVWFTGSSKTGQHIYEIAGKKFVKSVMELGGSNPGIIFEDADIDKNIEQVFDKRFLNNGQACSSLKRLIVHESIFDDIIKKLTKILESKKVGDPEDEETDFGSLAAKRQLDVLQSQVDDAISKGAKVVIGGKVPENLKGAYFLPTILTDIKPDMKVWNEEVFGPVLPIVSFKTEEEAVRLANDTQYGLGAYIYTRDKEKFLRVASKIDGGVIKINQAPTFYNSPFGGYKLSGMGREHGRAGFHELCQIKTIAIAK